MAKRGQHNNDSHDQDKSPGHNNPSKSMTITTGSAKKRDTYRKQALAHEDPARQAQAARNDWDEETRDPRRLDTRTRARQGDLDSGRSGSDSNADAGTRG